MSHLVCMEHKRRVVVIGTVAIHRSDRSKCSGNQVKAGDKILYTSAKEFHHTKET